MVYDDPWDKLYDQVYLPGGGDPDDWDHPHWLRCPSCNDLFRIERAQYEGKEIIICSFCLWLGHRIDGEKVGA